MAAFTAATWSVLRSSPNNTAAFNTNARNAVVAEIFVSITEPRRHTTDSPSGNTTHKRRRTRGLLVVEVDVEDLFDGGTVLK
jgi:hypothetical protein